MRDHKQADEHSENTTDQMQKETTPPAHSKGMDHLYNAAEHKQPAQHQYSA